CSSADEKAARALPMLVLASTSVVVQDTSKVGEAFLLFQCVALDCNGCVVGHLDLEHIALVYGKTSLTGFSSAVLSYNCC
ncbi:hypothetical protein BgiBS90_007971, partial [Biomphalaria glabrata]